MSLSALERSVRAKHPRCVRINLRLWYALKAANLIAQREVSPAIPPFAGVLLPHFGDVLLVLDPDLEGRAFQVEETVEVLALTTPSPVNAVPQQSPAHDAKVAQPESAIDRRWMGRY